MTREADLRLHLRGLAETYEGVQALRLQCGERIRAAAQGRSFGSLPAAHPADDVLRRVRAGADDGPLPVLGQTYRLHWREEQRLRAAMGEALEFHPVWPWLRRVRGIGPTVSTKLLGRLDIARAPTPSAFWAYCGLSTVPGVRYVCPSCGAVRELPADHRPSAVHQLPDGSTCSGSFVRDSDDVRVAPARPARGVRRSYDPAARKICYQIGLALLRAGGAYAAFYRRQRRVIEEARCTWDRGHVHMAALRKTEKLLLAHVWTEWARATGRVVVMPYVNARLGRNRYIAPQEMEEAGRS